MLAPMLSHVHPEADRIAWMRRFLVALELWCLKGMDEALCRGRSAWIRHLPQVKRASEGGGETSKRVKLTGQARMLSLCPSAGREKPRKVREASRGVFEPQDTLVE